ncbi:T9SS type A sorting domain-containing protein [Candidatus Neomarinimicrobiota bacterium]
MALESLTNLSLTFTRMLLGIIVLSATVSPQIVPEFVIHDDTSSGQYGPAISIDENNNLNIVWASDDSLYLAILDTTGKVVRRPLPFARSQNPSHLKIDSYGDHKAVVWQNFSSDPDGSTDMRGILLNMNGEPIGSGLPWESVGRNDALPDVAFINDTTLCLVWMGSSSSWLTGVDVYSQLVTTSLRLERSRFKVNQDSIEYLDNMRPRITAAPGNGAGVVVWYDERTGFPQVYGQRLDDTGMPIDTTFQISEIPTFTDGLLIANDMTIAVDMHIDGSFAVVWSHLGMGGSLQSLWLRRYNPDGAPTGEMSKVSNSDNLNLSSYWNGIDIAYDDNGQFVIVWEEMVESLVIIMSQRFSAEGNRIGGNISLQSVGNITEFEPAVALHNGNIYLAKYVTRVEGDLPQVTLSVWDFDHPLGIPAGVIPIPTKFGLYPAYPNPFNPNTTLSYDLPSAAKMSLVIYDVTGRKIAGWSAQKEAGSYRQIWAGQDASGKPLPSGVYLYRLVATPTDGSEAFVETRKMLLLK